MGKVTPKTIGQFLGVWQWYFREYVAMDLRMLAWTITLGVGSRVGVLAGFIATIKSAIWIISPETLPPFVLNLIPKINNHLDLILIAIPGTIFLATGFCKYLYQNKLNTVQRSSGIKAFRRVVEQGARNTDTNQEKYSAPKPLIGTQARNTYKMIEMLTTRIIGIIVMSVVLCIVIAGGIFADWKIMITLIGVCSIAAFGFLLHDYNTNASRLIETEQQNDCDASTIAKINQAFSNPHADPRQNANFAYEVKPHLELWIQTRESNEHREADSNLKMDIGQSLLIMIFLGAISTSHSEGHDIAGIAILFIIFRFILSYALGITRDISKLTKYHRKLVALRHNFR